MLKDVPSLTQLIKTLQQVPYLASKNLYRVASYFLKLDQASVERICQTIIDARKNITQCKQCFIWCEQATACGYCSDAKRDRSIICVVETWQELIAIEKTEGYMGQFHVLGGVISPLEGIGPEDLTINQLIARVDDSVKELILATNQTPEGEATAAFIARKLRDHHVKVTCLARGIPVGSTLEFMDRLTVYKAISERRPF